MPETTTQGSQVSVMSWAVVSSASWSECCACALQGEELSESQKQWQNERRGGNYGMGTKEMQAANYRNRKETEKKRRELFDIALGKFRKNDIQGVCFQQACILRHCKVF